MSLLLGGVGVAIDLNRIDADLGVALPMPLQLLVLLLPLVVEDQDLVPAAFAEHSAEHAQRRGVRQRVVLRAVRAGDTQHIAEFDGAVLACRNLLNLHNVARGDTVLLSTGTNDRVHTSSGVRSGERKPSSAGWADTCSLPCGAAQN